MTNVAHYAAWNLFIRHIASSPSARFAGLLVPLLWQRIAGPTRDGFTQMNVALKQRVETGAALQR